MIWDDLRIVLAIAEHSRLARAARALNTTHTTMGRRLARLEESLGVRLFEKTPDGYHLTPSGTAFVASAQRVESEILSLEAQMMGADVQLRGTLRVSTLDFIFVASSASFKSFIETYPSIDLTVTSSMEPVSLTRREADVVLRLSASPPEGLIGRRIASMTFAVFASPALVERVGVHASLSDYPWIGIDKRVETKEMQRWLRQNAPGAHVSVRIDENSFLMRQMVSAGLGAYFLPHWEGVQAGLIAISGDSNNLTIPIWMLTYKELRYNNRVRAFIDHMAISIPMEASFASAY